jgi:hypothetical protein
MKVSDADLLSMATEFYLGPEPLLGGVPFWWEFFTDSPRQHGVYIRNVGSPDDGVDRWAIKGAFGCLNKLGDWEYERLPSSRTDDFYERCRFSSVQEAIAYYRYWKKAVENYAINKFLTVGLDLSTPESRQGCKERIQPGAKKPILVNYDEIPEKVLKYDAKILAKAMA